MINPILITIAAIVVALVLIVALVASRYKVAKSDEAFIITGKKGKTITHTDGSKTTDLSGQKVIIGGGVFVVPFIHQLQRLSLKTQSIQLHIEDVLSNNNVRLNIEGVAMVKVGGNEASVRAAAQRFLSQQNEINRYATEVLNGSLRGVIGTLSVDQIIRDRKTFAERVQEEAETTLSQQGLIIDTLQIQSIEDDNNYIANLSRPEAARAAKDAEIAEAEAKQASAEKKAEAEQKIAMAQKDLAIKQAQIKAETDKALMEAEAAGPIAKAAQEQNVISANELVAEKQASLTAKQLESTVNKPAEAAKYQTIQKAEADKAAAIAASEAELARRKNEAEAVKLEGEAEAAAIKAKGEAEAEALLKKAEAYKQYNNAAITQMFVEVLPKIAQEISAPLANIKDMTVISNDGATKLTQTTTDILTQTMGVAKELTGIDFKDLIPSFNKSDNLEVEKVDTDPVETSNVVEGKVETD